MKLRDEQMGLIGWAIVSFFLFILILIIKWIWPSSIPFEIFQFWKNNRIVEGILASWPIFLWAGGLTFIISHLTTNSREENENAELIFSFSFISSVIAGVAEETIFRWILFFYAIIAAKIINFFVFGFLGFGVIEFLHMNFFGPIVNYVTFGKIEWMLYGMGWYVGAAILSANANFRNGHAYLGFVGLINSWIIGFFLFWVMFAYGIITAIIVHFLYDFIIDIVRYYDAVKERQAEAVHS
jgi:hypothetical protein